MYERKKGIRKINGKMVETFEREVTDSGTSLFVQAGTTGYKGTGRDGGGRTYLCIGCLHGDFYFKELTDNSGNAVAIDIACCGDDGMNALMKALKFACQVIEEQCHGTND